MRAVLVAASLAGSGRAAADETIRSYQVANDDTARLSIQKFRTFSARQEWRAAVQELQKLFDLPPTRGVVVRVEDAKPARYESAWRAALRLFDALPAEGRATWEERQRRQAEELLLRGLRLRREEDLVAVAKRYPVRDIRRRAHDALAHLALARGDFDRSARELESLLECVEPADQAEVHARLLFARAQAGDAEATERTAILAKPYLDRTVPTPSGPAVLGEFAERMRALAAVAGGRFAGGRRMGGDRHGTGLSDPPPRAEAPGWRDAVPTGYAIGEYSDDDDPPWQKSHFRPVVPLIAQGTVFLNDGLGVSARDVATGRELWNHRGPQRRALWRDHPNTYHGSAYADGIVYAAIATRSDAPDDNIRFYGKIILYPLPHRALHAFDARTGEVLWAHDAAGTRGRPDAEELDSESVACAPLVVGDDVVVVTWRYNNSYEARVTCFDRHTGATRWRTSIVHAQQESNLFGRPVKELLAPPPAELDGMIYVSTGLGVAAAVDRVTGAVSWIAEHEAMEVPPTYQWYETRDREVVWRAAAIAATRTAVVMTPLESQEMVALDPRTGARLWQWRARRMRDQSNWFLGVDEGRAYALGTKLFALDLRTGREVWPDADAGRLAPKGVQAEAALGRGVLTRGAVYVPTRRGILRLDSSTGAVTDLQDLPQRPNEQRRRLRTDGDLVSADGALLVTTDASVECYYRFEDLRARLEARLAEAPADPQLRLEAGEILRAAGRTDEAIVYLEEGLAAAVRLPARSGQRTETALRRALTDELLSRAQHRRDAADGPGAWTDLGRAVEVARDRGDLVRALFALATCAEETGRDAECDAALLRIRTEFADVQTNLTPASPERTDAGALASFRLGERAARRGDLRDAVNRWLALVDERPDAALGGRTASTQVDEALRLLEAKHGARVTEIVDERCREDLDAARNASDATALQRLARTSPSAGVRAEAGLLAATLHLAADRARDAAASLESVLLRPLPPETLARALWLLHEAYFALEETPRERAALRRIVAEAAAAKLADGRVAGDAARAELEHERFRAAPSPLADPRPPMELRWDVNEGPDAPKIEALQIESTRPRALEGHLLLHQAGVLRAAQGATGKDLWRIDSRVDPRAVHGTPTRLVVAGHDARARPQQVRVDGLAAESGETAWTQRLRGQYVHSASSLGIVYVLHSDVDQRGERAMWLTALTADKGERVAERRVGIVQARVTCAADAVVVYEVLPDAVSRRRAHTLDGATLAPRGVVELDGFQSPFSLAVPGTSIVATTWGQDGVVGIDVRTGSLAWPAARLANANWKNVLVVPGGVLVTDDENGVRRIDAVTGREVWTRNLADGDRALVHQGEAAEGDLFVAALLANTPAGTDAVAVALDAATGAPRWRTPLPVTGKSYPFPTVLQNVVAFEIPGERGRVQRTESTVVHLARADGKLLGTITHPVLGRLRPKVVHDGPFVVLTSLTDVAATAVFSGRRP